MSKISKEREKRIKEQILEVLYNHFPKMYYSKEIGDELLRKDEFILRLMFELKKDNLVTGFEEKKGRGIRRKWGLSKEVYEEYKKLY